MTRGRTHWWKRIRALTACVMVLGVCGGCGDMSSDGGVGGTGISATVSGNVIGAGGEVTIREPESGLETVTDGTGAFELDGPFVGETTLVFLPPVGSPATAEILVYGGAAVSLDNVRLQDGRATPEKIGVQILQERGVMSTAICSENGGTFEFEDPAGVVTVLLHAATVIVKGDDDTQPLACADLKSGVRFKIRGEQIGDELKADRISVTKTGGPRSR